MSVSEEMNRIERTIEETLDVARRREAKQKANSRIEVYRKALKEVRQVAGNDAMRELGAWIRERIEASGDPPSGRDVRQKGAAICREHGEEISTGSWLGA